MPNTATTNGLKARPFSTKLYVYLPILAELARLAPQATTSFRAGLRTALDELGREIGRLHDH